MAILDCFGLGIFLANSNARYLEINAFYFSLRKWSAVIRGVGTFRILTPPRLFNLIGFATMLDLLNA